MTDAFDAAAHFADKKARVYDRHVRQVVPGYDVLHQLARLHLAQAAPADAHILIVGAGSGMEILSLAQGFPNRRFTAVDPAAEMLKQARVKVAEAGLVDRVTFHQGRLQELAETDPFDAATLMLVMQFLPDDPNAEGGGKHGMLNGISERLKPGAPLVIADALHPDESQPGEPEFELLKALWATRRQDEGMPDDEQRLSAEHIEKNFRWISEARLRTLLAHAGLEPPVNFWRSLLFTGWVTTKRA